MRPTNPADTGGGHDSAQPEDERPGGRPPDVDTAFWLWVAAIPLMVTCFVVNLVTSPTVGPSALVYAFSGVFVLVLTSIVVTFLMLLRQGYRWARTLLIGGGLATIVYAVSDLFTLERPPAAAMLYAVAGIFGSVLIAGGGYLLHRKDANAYFAR